MYGLRQAISGVAWAKAAAGLQCAALFRRVAPASLIGQASAPPKRRTALRPASILQALVVSLLVLAGPCKGATDPGVPSHLTIASEGARPPYNYFDGDALAGFEIDLGNDLCRRMAVTCTFVAQSWDDLIPGLLAHRYDAIMAAMEIDEARQAEIAFSTPYVRMPSAFLVRKDTDLAAATPDALAGRRIGVEKGGTHEAFLAKIYPRARIVPYGSLDDAILDLEAGRADAAIGDKDAIVTFLKTRRDATCCRILADVPRYAAFFGDGIGIGLRKQDRALKAAFDQALVGSMADGTFAKIARRYFDFPVD